MRLQGYSNYEIYPETGQVWSYKRKKFIGNNKSTGNYWMCTLYDDDGNVEYWYIHRLIWVVVNGPIPEGLEVNHIDENKNNNSIFNLNLMSRKENCNWGTRNIRSNTKRRNNTIQSKPIVALKDDSLKMFFLSGKEAERKGISSNGISRCARGERSLYKGYQWKFFDDYLGDLLEQIQDEDMALEKAS